MESFIEETVKNEEVEEGDSEDDDILGENKKIKNIHQFLTTIDIFSTTLGLPSFSLSPWCCP